MDTFDFPLFTWVKRYPESSGTVTYGRGWQFASKPKGPDQVIYILNFKAMKFFLNGAGVVSTSIFPKINIQRLDNFYVAHKLHEKFILPLPGTGNITVRFKKPLEFELLENGNGLVKPFSLEMISQP